MPSALAQIIDQRMRLNDALAQPVDYWVQQGMKRMDAILAVRRLAAWGEVAMAAFGPMPAAVLA